MEEENRRGEGNRGAEQRRRRGEAEQTRRVVAENRTEESREKDQKRRHAHTDFNFRRFSAVAISCAKKRLPTHSFV